MTQVIRPATLQLEPGARSQEPGARSQGLQLKLPAKRQAPGPMRQELAASD